MFYYIIDKHVSGVFENRRTERALAWIRSHQIAGEYHKAQGFDEIVSLATTAAHKRFKSIVVIGDDSSLTALLNCARDVDTEAVAFGYVPVAKESQATNDLNLPDYRHAMRTLANRKLTNLKLATFNNQVFPLAVDITANSQMVQITIDDKLKLELPASTISLQNNFNTDSPAAKPITITATTKPHRIKSSDRSFLDIKGTFSRKRSDTPVLRLNANTITISSQSKLDCELLNCSFTKATIGEQFVEARMITTKSTKF